MIFEGTGKYFFLLFIIFLIIYVTVKICLYKIFKIARVSAWKALIPFYNRLVLIELLDIKKSVFFMTLIPIANLYYYNIIIKKLLEAFNMDSQESIYYLLIPMYKFPELVFKNPKFTLHLYDNTEEFLKNEKKLFEKEKPVEEVKNVTVEVNNQTVIKPSSYNQLGQENQTQNIYNTESVFSNSNLVPDERKETTIEAKEEVVKEEVNPINFVDNRPRVCPNCGTKLEPTAKICFFCGKQIS